MHAVGRCRAAIDFHSWRRLQKQTHIYIRKDVKYDTQVGPTFGHS